MTPEPAVATWARAETGLPVATYTLTWWNPAAPGPVCLLADGLIHLAPEPAAEGPKPTIYA